jgi:Zn-dependent protease with chaperone function
MNTATFRRSFGWSLAVSALLVAWLVDHQVTPNQGRATLLIAVLLLVICLLISFLTSYDFSPTRARNQSQYDAPAFEEVDERTMLSRHQPLRAQFMVREFAAENARKVKPQFRRV